MKNIDKIFNESFQHYERQPRTEAWEKLQARLEKKNSKVLPLWWKYASAASVAFFLGVAGYWVVNDSSNESQIVATNTTIKALPKVKSIPEVLIQSKSKENTIVKTDDLEPKNLSPVTNVPANPHVSKHTPLPNNSSVAIIKPLDKLPIRKQSDLQNSNSPIIALETIKTKTTDIKNPIEENTIVLVLENTKPKKEEETIVLNFVDTKVETVAQNVEPEKKQSRVGKIWEQLKRAKNGENVNWGEVGLKPQKVLARADAKIENALTRGESNDK